jgi:hypothetical protein
MAYCPGNYHEQVPILGSRRSYKADLLYRPYSQSSFVNLNVTIFFKCCKVKKLAVVNIFLQIMID